MKIRHGLIYIIIAGLIILFLPHLLRLLSQNPSLIGSQAYYHLQSELNTPYHILLDILPEPYLASRILPFVFGVFSLFIYYLILKRLDVNDLTTFFSAGILILSPIFIYTFTISNLNALCIFLSLLGFYLYILGNPWTFIISIIVFLLASVSIFNIFIILACLLIWTQRSDQGYRRFLITSYVLIAALIIFNLPFFNEFESVPQGPFIHFTDLGAEFGFGIFGFILAMTGISFSWKNKRDFVWVYILISTLLFLAIFISPWINAYTIFILAYFQGKGFMSIIRLEWKLDTIKFLSIMAIICGLVFTSSSYITRLSSFPPDNDTYKSIVWLGSQPQGIVLSHPSYGYWIETIADKQVAADYLNQSETVYDIFMENDLSQAEILLSRLGIRYIYLTDQMREMIWEKENAGLGFLLTNNQTFKKIYGIGKTDIWIYNEKTD